MEPLHEFWQAFQGESLLCDLFFNCFADHAWKNRTNDFDLKCHIVIAKLFQLVKESVHSSRPVRADHVIYRGPDGNRQTMRIDYFQFRSPRHPTDLKLESHGASKKQIKKGWELITEMKSAQLKLRRNGLPVVIASELRIGRIKSGNAPGIGVAMTPAFRAGGSLCHSFGVRLYTMNGSDWSKRYPLIVEDAARIKGSAILDAEAVWLDPNGVADFEALHSRLNDQRATACAFDLLLLNGEDMRVKSYVERKAALRKLLRGDRGIQYVEHAEEHGDELFTAVCKLGLEGIVSKRIDAPYRSGPARSWLKIRNPKAPAATRAADGTF